jgi:hypothetical protein
MARGVAVVGHGLEALWKRTRQQLLATARELELRGVSRLRKNELAQRVLEALRERGLAAGLPGEAPDAAAPPPRVALAPATDPAPAPQPPPSAPEGDPGATAKLDLGPGARRAKPVQHIPWSYGVDRVTAAAVDPEQLYVHWEITDEAIEVARGRLREAGEHAWLALRVYDTTGVLFDGTNAHGHFDHRIERSDRQWFFHIGKPTSSAFVDVGLRAPDGSFRRIARSGRVDFPRAEPAPWSDPEWMTVVAGEPVAGSAGAPAAAAGWAREGAAAAGASAGGAGAPAGGGPGPAAGEGHGAAPGAAVTAFPPIPLWVLRQTASGHEAWLRQMGWEGEVTRVEWSASSGGEGWFEVEGRFEWQGPLTLARWEAGPFSYPVEVEEPRREAWQGKTMAYQVGGVTHVVDGPWEVVIKNLGARVGRSVVARWEVYRSWPAQGGREVRDVPATAGATARPAGSSALAPGASEQVWLGASELRYGGASELWRLGASELRLGGASERRLAGSSAWMHAGASERAARGASELRLGGASERTLAGGSERALGGASEQRRGGASELRPGGASELRLGGASERVLGGASELRAGASEQRARPPAGPIAPPSPGPADGAPSPYPPAPAAAPEEH